MCGPASWKASVASSHRDSSSFFIGPLFLRTLTVACRRSRFPTWAFLPALRPGWNFWAIAFFEQCGLLFFFFFGVAERRTATSDPFCALVATGFVVASVSEVFKFNVHRLHSQAVSQVSLQGPIQTSPKRAPPTIPNDPLSTSVLPRSHILASPSRKANQWPFDCPIDHLVVITII